MLRRRVRADVEIPLVWAENAVPGDDDGHGSGALVFVEEAGLVDLFAVDTLQCDCELE